MMIQNTIAFDESKYEIREQLGSPIVVAKKKIILPEKKNISIVNSANGIIITDSMELIHLLYTKQDQYSKIR